MNLRADGYLRASDFRPTFPVVAEPFTIEADGDEPEKGWWAHWMRDHFPSYERFWVERIVPLTYRVTDRQNIRFQRDEELSEAGYTPEDVAVAQLHYTLAVHLARVFELLDDARAFETRSYMANRPFSRDAFFESFARLSGASDVSDELLARRATPGEFDPRYERDGDRARRAWRDENPDPLRPVRWYRNRLVHGRVVPEIYVKAQDSEKRELGDLLLYPRLEEVDTYLDWRVAFDVAQTDEATLLADFDEAALVVLDAWERIVGHVEEAWQRNLVGATDGQEVEPSDDPAPVPEADLEFGTPRIYPASGGMPDPISTDEAPGSASFRSRTEPGPGGEPNA